VKTKFVKAAITKYDSTAIRRLVNGYQGYNDVLAAATLTYLVI